EPIILILEPGGTSPLDEPHNGEEFGYVITGTVFIHIGNKKFKAKKNESFYFKPYEQHYISNEGSRQAQVLWIATPPSF
ncbi:MAG: cupin domain-containing protein, partial [Clostridiales bacterium]|nr:cupin domain-containing protein [Clostridiales bacterium]